MRPNEYIIHKTEYNKPTTLIQHEYDMDAKSINNLSKMNTN